MLPSRFSSCVPCIVATIRNIEVSRGCEKWALLPIRASFAVEITAVTLVNHQFRLAARPIGMPKRSDWSYTEEPVREPGDG